jgi:hypothetical protein
MVSVNRRPELSNGLVYSTVGVKSCSSGLPHNVNPKCFARGENRTLPTEDTLPGAAAERL